MLAQEEARFAETLASGMTMLEAAIAALGADGGARTIPGETVFKLYDTYGFPVDLTADIARERGLGIDEPAFEVAMQAQRARARAASRFGVDLRESVQLDHRTDFKGYETLAAGGTVVALIDAAGTSVAELAQGDDGRVVLDRTPFYAESGGQVGDTGTLTGAGGRFRGRGHAEAARRPRPRRARRRAGGCASATRSRRSSRPSSAPRRPATTRRRTCCTRRCAQVLGTHVQQKGSLVEPERLRFDFSHFAPVTAEEIARIERLVNAEVLKNLAAETRLMNYDAAVASGAVALFGEKYGDTVRVLRFGEFSTELCGGTHVGRTGDIGPFKIVSEGGVAAGVRRIEAVAGEAALAYLNLGEHLLREVGELVRGARQEVVDKVVALIERAKRLEREVDTLKARLASGQGKDLAAGAVLVEGAKVVAARVDGLDGKALRAAVDQLKEKLASGVIVLGSSDAEGKVTLVAGVTADLTARVKAGEIVAQAAARVGGKGGGRPDFAQAGGTDAAALDGALALVPEWVRERLSKKNP